MFEKRNLTSAIHDDGLKAKHSYTVGSGSRNNIHRYFYFWSNHKLNLKVKQTFVNYHKNINIGNS